MMDVKICKKKRKNLFNAITRRERKKRNINRKQYNFVLICKKNHKNDRSTSKQPNKYTNDTTTTIFKTNRTYAQFFVVVVVQVRME